MAFHVHMHTYLVNSNTPFIIRCVHYSVQPTETYYCWNCPRLLDAQSLDNLEDIDHTLCLASINNSSQRTEHATSSDSVTAGQTSRTMKMKIRMSGSHPYWKNQDVLQDTEIVVSPEYIRLNAVHN